MVISPKQIQTLSFFLLIFIISIALIVPATAQEEGENPAITNIFSTFAPISVHVIKDRRIRGILMVDFLLALQNKEDEEKVDLLRPRIRSSVIEALTRVANARVNVRKPLDLDLISMQMQAAVDRVLGQNFAEVLIAVASTQPR